nr:VanW family protein [uncultured Acetatifactor sp.]
MKNKVKKWIKKVCFPTAVFVCVLMIGVTVKAQESAVVKKGIFAGDIDLSGMSEAEARQAVTDYVEELKETEITLLASGDTEVAVTAGDLGITWANPELVSEALEVGTRGNVIERYKTLKDLEHDNLVYPIQLSFNLQMISDILLEKCVQYDVQAMDATLTRENGEFQVVEGKTGYTLDVETSIDKVNKFLTEEWDHTACTIALDVDVTEPRGKAEELAQVKDVLGTFTTSYASSGSNRSQNVANGANLINGTLLYPGDEFSAYECVAPFTKANGYYMAGSYMNGKVVDSLGGGICQVSTTLYNAVLLAELEVTERFNHSMIVTYVEPSADAAIAEGLKDFKFVNNLEYPVYIEGSTSNKHITFTIYGKETRASDREVRYESKVLEVNQPPADIIYPDPGQPIGYIVYDSAHVGYKAELWKVVLEGGKEVSRTQVNSSSYKMVPRSATVGTATADPAAYEEIMAAIGTGSVDHVKNVIAILIAQAQAPVESPEIGDE